MVSIFEIFLQKINDLLKLLLVHVNRIEWPEAKPATSSLNFDFFFYCFCFHYLFCNDFWYGILPCKQNIDLYNIKYDEKKIENQIKREKETIYLVLIAVCVCLKTIFMYAAFIIIKWI